MVPLLFVLMMRIVYTRYQHNIRIKMKPINVTMDKESLQRLDNQCKREGRNRSQQIRELIKEQENRVDDRK